MPHEDVHVWHKRCHLTDGGQFEYFEVVLSQYHYQQIFTKTVKHLIIYYVPVAL